MHTYESLLSLLLALICFVATLLGLPTDRGDGAYNENASSKEKAETMTCGNTDNTPERIHEVRLKYDDLFWRQPNVHAVAEGAFTDENREWTETRGIVVYVTEKVDQSTLPAEDRIPDCLEGVPVQFDVGEPFSVIP